MPTMRIIHGNVLVASQRPLSTELLNDLTELMRLIRRAKTAINSAFEKYPEVWIMHLGAEAEVFTEEFNIAAGVFDTPDGLTPKFAEIWQLFADNGFIPKIRISSGFTGNYRGAYLLFCKPPATEIAPDLPTTKE